MVHKTFRVAVVGNTIWDNGQVSKEAPDERQAYAGLTLNSAQDVILRNNHVSVTDSSDSAYVLVSGATFDMQNTGGNTACNGKVSKDYGDTVMLLPDNCALDLSNI